MFPYLIASSIGLLISVFTVWYFLSKRAGALQHTIDDLNQENRDGQIRFETLFQHSTIGVAELDLSGRFLRVNQHFANLLGYSVDELPALNYLYLLEREACNQVQLHLQKMLENKLDCYYADQQCQRKDGSIVYLQISLAIIRYLDGKPPVLILHAEDKSQVKQAEERLRLLAYHDPLTGLANRNKIEQFINHILAISRRHEQGFALMYVDIDHLKNVNDTLSREAGDAVLQIVAERLKSVVRNTDMVARFDGDEFLLLITDVDKVDPIALIAQKILNAIMQTIMIQGTEVYVTASIGISLYPHDGQTVASLFKNADLAMTRAREQGRNAYQFYSDELTAKAQEKLLVQTELAHAYDKDEFYLEYQPKINLNSRKITGVEAFLRWQNAQGNVVAPMQIIQLAEESGLIIPVSEWIMKTAAHTLQSLQAKGLSGLSMAVNCSFLQFKQGVLVEQILRTLSETGISPDCFEIEITESMVMSNPDMALRVLYAVKDIGVQITIDDFGMGYWSLNNLRRLSIDRIKIDRSFTRQITTDETSAAITRAIIAMVKKLGMKCIAEGVETREQYQFLEQEGCDEIQGYYITQPLSAQALAQFIKHPVPAAEAVALHKDVQL